MNKPTLNVLGRKHNILSVNVEDAVTGDKLTFWDKDVYKFFNEQEKVDFAQAIENPSNAQKFIERLEKTIDESVKYLIELKLQIADTFIRDIEVPFPNIELKPIVEEIKGQVSFIEGLENALEIAKGNVNVEVPSTE
ncbi:TPA: hypothetical protein NJY08_004376 [Salmonella enterica subsp. enterica serovar Typhi str. AG3]|nr:hypothetical protein [Salmonella enterica subsp. enterica serovar Typhi str. AG3]